MILKTIRSWLRRLLRRERGRPAPRARKGSGGAGRRRPPTALGTFGTRIGRHAGLYGLGQGLSLLLGLVTLAVLTRFLAPPEFGLYALWYFLAALLTLAYTLGWIRGSMLWVFGGEGDEDDDEEEELDGRPGGESAEEKRRALGTAFAFIGAMGVAGTVLILASASAVAELLTDDGGAGRLALLAALAGAAWAPLMLATAVCRRERRPHRYLFLTLARPVLVLAVTVPLVARDPTIENAVVGLAGGTALAAAVALVAVRRSFSFSFAAADARRIARLGVRYLPLIAALWVIANGGVFFLGTYSTPTEAGFLRLAAGAAAIASLPVSAFLMAWGPMQREPIFDAVGAERGRLAANGVLATYFALGAIGILLGLVVGADFLVQIAPAGYEDAAPLIPLVGLGLLLYGWFRVIRRTGRFPNRLAWFIGLAVAAAAVFVIACIALIPGRGADGAALALVGAFLLAATGMTLRSQLGDRPIPLGYGRIAIGLGIAAGCYLVARPLGDAAGDAAPVVDLAALAAYPALLVATGTVPRAHLAPLSRMAAAAVPRRHPSRNGSVDLDSLDRVQAALLEVVVRHRRPVADVAPLVGTTPDRLAAEVVAALRQVGAVGGPSGADARIGGYLLSPAPVAARDALWRRLSAEGADALEVDALSVTLERLRRAPASAWPGGDGGARAARR